MSKHDVKIDFIKHSKNELSIEEHAKFDFLDAQAKFELQLFKDRERWIKESSMSAYFQSTRIKAAFARQLILWEHRKFGQTVKMIANSLEIPRETVSRIVTECHAAKYIYRNPDPDYQRYWLPSKKLVDDMAKYAEYIATTWLNSGFYESSSIYPELIKYREMKRKM
tara:strand:+ start:839 stop:1339 length:501 start_codon:yes stop_codon:yes gene_type:complete